MNKFEKHLDTDGINEGIFGKIFSEAGKLEKITKEATKIAEKWKKISKEAESNNMTKDQASQILDDYVADVAMMVSKSSISTKLADDFMRGIRNNIDSAKKQRGLK